MAARTHMNVHLFMHLPSAQARKIAKQGFRALLLSVGSLPPTEKRDNILLWALSHAKDGLELMYASEPVKLHWAMTTLHWFT
ncbi:hypothetical protein LTR15_001275 [Elasticomyces elasticus]|nr:hypothetical protein LTR15_001275 [Elasticomyces elasticus]